MATGGVDIPVPQKRPTVIRPSKPPDIDDDRPSPVRPVPPVPVRPAAPTVPPRTDDVAPVRQQPPVPGRPPSEPTKPPPPITGRPPPPVPNRVGDVAPKQAANGMSASHRPPPTPDKPAGRPKARPEITIVSARPMSEVGFRSQENSSPLNNLATDTKPAAASPPRPKSQPLKPATDTPLISFDDDIPDSSSGLYTEVPAAAPSRGLPPPVPPAANKPSQPKPPPDRPLPSPRSEAPPTSAKPTLPEPPSSLPQAAVASSGGETRPARPVNPKVGVPLPAVPRNPPAPSRPPSISPRKADMPANLTTNNSEQSEEPEPFSTLDNVDDDVTNDTVKSNGDTAPTYAVINKPKRPTIIRPGRATVKENKDEDNKEAPKIPPKIVPRLSDLEDQPTASDNVNKANSDNTPEFLRLKLKNTVSDGLASNDSDKATAGSGATDRREATPVAAPPGVAPKPKPTVLPKPKVAAKPNISAKPVVPKPIVPKPVVAKPFVEKSLDNDADTTEKKVPIDSETNKESHIDNNSIVEKSKDKLESVLFKRPGSVKRPTIIRPTKPAWGSTENVRKAELAGDPDPVDVAESADDSAVRRRPQPPLPTKRPVSMSNIPQMLAQEGLSLMSTSSHSVKSGFSSSENVNSGDKQSKPPPPRPMARARPMSMAAGDGTQASPPSVSPRLPRLPPGAQGLPGMSAGDRVPVEPHRPAPPKPDRGPTSPEMARGKTSSSDDEDEFVMAQTKPDRPQGPPRPAQRQSQPEPEVKKSPPTRPGGLPTARKMSSPEEPEQPGLEGVKMRPARPGSKPTRPLSMPVKAVLPSRPQLPKAGSSRGKGLPALPPRPGPGHPAYHHMMCVPHGQALYDYKGRQGDELSFKQGDIILLERAMDAEWLVGKLDDNEGMFPRGFVKVLMPLPGDAQAMVEEDSSDENEEFYDASPEKPDTIGRGPRCRARFDFDGEGQDDLAFEEGDVIRLLERAGTEWRRGEINGRSGLFPLAYVEIIEDLGAEEGGDGGSSLVTALFDFEGEKGDLNFTAGEKIQVTHCVNEEWLYGEIGARKGQFPIQFIDHVPQDLPPLPQQAKPELSPSQALNLGASSKDMIGNALSQWDTADSDNTIQSHNPKADNHVSETPYAIATYDFPGQTADDLSFSIGDRIELVERIDADWLKGKLNSHVGMFPAGFVDVKIDIIATSSAPPVVDDGPQGVETVALYDFQGEADNELTFCAGDQLLVQDLVEGAGDWRWGVHRDRRGIFPAAFVHVS